MVSLYKKKVWQSEYLFAFHAFNLHCSSFFDDTNIIQKSLVWLIWSVKVTLVLNTENLMH